jgi:hypothetical protein
LNLKDDKGKALFSGTEQMKFTNEYGHYLVWPRRMSLMSLKQSLMNSFWT